MAVLYKRFASSLSKSLDFSEAAELSLFNHESYGTALSANNGFAVGKQFLNLQVNMWQEDIRNGILCKSELYQDDFPEWWLDSVLKNTFTGKSYQEIMKECEF